MLSYEQSLSLAEDYKAGLSTNGLIRKYGVSAATVRSHLQKHGVQMRSPGQRKFTEVVEKEIKQKYMAREMTQSALAAKYGTTDTTIRAVLRRCLP